MTHVVTIRDKSTGAVDEVEVKVRPSPPSSFKAMIFWSVLGVPSIEHGDSEDAAVQNVFRKFSSLAVLGKYEIKLAVR
jgi:hypothetical protein